MRLDIKLLLAWRFFKGPLFSFFILFAFVSCCIFSFFLITDSYEKQVEERFASKQPHFTMSLEGGVSSWSDYKASGELENLKRSLQDEGSILSVSEFTKVTKWLRLKAATAQQSGFESAQEYDKFSSGNVTLIGLERHFPSVIPLTELNYYDAGAYKFKITNLEFAADWLMNPSLVLPNAVLDASFFAPISQEVSIKSVGHGYQGKIKAFINDYNDESILYMGIEQISAWLDDHDLKEEGLYLRILDSRDIEQSKNVITALLAKTGENWTVTTWLDEKSKQKSILLMTKLLGYSLISVLVFALILILGLNQANVFIKKAKSLNILYMTGYLLTLPLVVTSFFVGLLGLLLAYFVTFIWLKPMILQVFSVSTTLHQGMSWGVCITVLLLINLLNLIGMKNRLGY